MSISKNISRIPIRQFTTGSSNALDPPKMQAKSVVLSQWKVVAQLKDYLSKFTNDKTFENALNKEFAHFLQKVQPSVYGSELIRYFESVTAPRAETNLEPGSSIINGLLKKRTVEEPKKIVPKWKEARLINTKESVAARTRLIIDLLTDAKSDDFTLSRIEDLSAVANQHPEAKHVAVKEGAISLLLKTRKQSQNAEVQGACSELLASLGYTNPVQGKGVKILSIDGGGVRGILVIEMLKKLEELTGKPVHEIFDMICGVSTGAIIATLIGGKRCNLDEIYEIYKNLSIQIFTQSALKGTSNLVWSHSYYDTALWEKMLKDQIGEQTLISTARNPKYPKLCALSAVVNQSNLSAYIFRNYSLPCRVQSQYMGNHNHLIWETVRASAAAPTYFEEFKLGNHLHQDGGILFNNPTAVAIHEAKLLWPEAPIQCVVSCGTGRSLPAPMDHILGTISSNYSSWKDKFYAVINSATDTEGVHTMLSDLLPPGAYYRFNPYLTEMLDIAEIDPEKLELLKRDAIMYLRRNEDKFQEAAKVLNVERSVTQKTMDWINEQSQIHGLRTMY